MTITTAAELIEHCAGLGIDPSTVAKDDVAFHSLVTDNGYTVNAVAYPRFETYSPTERAAVERFLKCLRRAVGDRPFVWREFPQVEKTVLVPTGKECWTVRAKMIACHRKADADVTKAA